MEPTDLLFVALALGLVALLYSSVGHAGASGYIAVMALVGVAVETIKPTALTLNILVAAIGAVRFWRAGHFSWRLFWPFALLSVPAAFAGGYVTLPGSLLQKLVGAVLLLAAARLFLYRSEAAEVREPHTGAALAAGGGLGFLAGLTGTGGGIFLTPLLLLCRWGGARTAAAVSVVFIFVNSVAGLLGWIAGGGRVPMLVWPFAIAVVLGGYIGSGLGSRRLHPSGIRIILAVILVLAGGKLVLPIR